MNQILVDGVLYVLDTEAYVITENTDATVINVPMDSYNAYLELNPNLPLVPYNYNVIKANREAFWDYVDKVVTSETNAPLMAVLYAKGLAANANYMTLAEAKAVTNEQLNGLLNANKTVQTFNEFQYFTNVTKICTSDDSEASKTLSPFKGCTSLKEITLPKSVKEFGARAFDQTKNLLKLNGLEQVHNFGLCALQGTFGSASTQNYDTIIVNKLTGGNMFNNVFKSTNGYGIKQLEINNGVEEIGVSAFYKLYKLERIKLPGSLKTIGGLASNQGNSFTGCLNLKRLNSDVDGVMNIPNNVTQIGWQAFYCAGSTDLTGNNHIKEINIPDSVTTIGNAAFGGFYNCERINIGSGITTLDSKCFTTIGRDSEKLVITITATTPPSITADTFIEMNSNAEIFVPAESVEAYKTATNWSTYASKIKPL